MEPRALQAALNAHGDQLNALFNDFHRAQVQTWAAFTVALGQVVGTDALRRQLQVQVASFTAEPTADRAERWRNELLEAALHAIAPPIPRR